MSNTKKLSFTKQADLCFFVFQILQTSILITITWAKTIPVKYYENYAPSQEYVSNHYSFIPLWHHNNITQMSDLFVWITFYFLIPIERTAITTNLI